MFPPIFLKRPKPLNHNKIAEVLDQMFDMIMWKLVFVKGWFLVSPWRTSQFKFLNIKYFLISTTNILQNQKHFKKDLSWANGLKPVFLAGKVYVLRLILSSSPYLRSAKAWFPFSRTSRWMVCYRWDLFRLVNRFIFSQYLTNHIPLFNRLFLAGLFSNSYIIKWMTDRISSAIIVDTLPCLHQ